MEKVTRTVCLFYNHWIWGILSFFILTVLYGLSLSKTNFSWLAILYVVSSSYILSSLEIKLINVLSDLLDSWTSKLQGKYRMRGWERSNLNDIDRFYKIGWTDDYLSDLLIYLDRKKILPTKKQIDYYLKENGSNGTINTISLYEVLVSRLQKLSTAELLTLKHYIEIKDSNQHSYHKKFTITSVARSIFTIILFILNSKYITSINLGIVTFDNIPIPDFKKIIPHVPLILMMIMGLIMMFFIISISLSFYNAKHLRYADVIHQALEMRTPSNPIMKLKNNNLLTHGYPCQINNSSTSIIRKSLTNIRPC